MISSHLSLLMLSCLLGAALAAGDSSFLQLSSDPLSSDQQEEDDVLSQHMYTLYEKYNKESHLKERNTVRGFRASRVSGDHRMMYQLNLSSLQDSEVILSATFHFLLDKSLHPNPWFCKRLKRPSCRSTDAPSINLLFCLDSFDSKLGSAGSFLSNVTFHPDRRGVWQMKDVTQVIKEARNRGNLTLLVELDLRQQQHKKPDHSVLAGRMPYLLLYANDKALAEPNSVATSLQRFDPFSEGGDLLHRANSSPFSAQGRLRREVNLLFEPIQNNELPEVNDRPDGYRKDDLWKTDWYLALKPKPKSERKEEKRKSNVEDKMVQRASQQQVLTETETKRIKTNNSAVKEVKDSSAVSNSRRRKNEERNEKKKTKGSAKAHSPILSFDEKTMRRARRRQWSGSQHRGCSRRNLRVDFADIGWSEWVIAPKAFEAYYCAGTCGFPLPQVTRPSNHATIQSIVRAVGIIPGVPEPCCVPENMSPLAVLFHDESSNLVLKIYPNMSVQSCSCR
ncbi:growth/differentiation factor 10 [Oryzias latipes]|uniref:Growth/differentiation factor 10 n=1 Tax=Oryzias latipes TaxID=8090 RepID=H2LXY1_ORYLA|nr:growth/differentiation factor 10 [Oryzias latipes]